MRRLASIVLLAAMSLLSACRSSPEIYGPSETDGQKANGSVPPFGKFLPGDGSRVRLIFVHGVGDHCSGYAFGRKREDGTAATDAWFNEDVAKLMGFRRIQAPGDTDQPLQINASILTRGEPDPKAFVEYSVQSYEISPPGNSKATTVQAIEITWSPLTRWIKTAQLGYDSPSAFKDPQSAKEDCRALPDPAAPKALFPPKRLMLDEAIKEDVLDRKLADAILYVGSFGDIIERGVAEAICHVVTGQPVDKRCVWPETLSKEEEGVRYFFVTHSLGSRVVYDTLLDLGDADFNRRRNPLRELDGKPKALGQAMLVNTPVIYMMSNQLSLLGLARIDGNANSAQPQHPYFHQNMGILGGVVATEPKVGFLQRPECKNEICALGVLRDQTAQDLQLRVPRLQIVAFSDTNDLLTWHIPPWYANTGPSDKDLRPGIDIINVFVQNAWHWLIAESPSDAHNGYFSNPDVKAVMLCGAENGKLLPPC